MQEAEEGAPEKVEYVPTGQGVHVDGAAAPKKALYVPAAQRVQVEGAAAPTKALYVPAPQRVQVALEAAPMADDQVPAGQGVGFIEESGQNEPEGHMIQLRDVKLAKVPRGQEKG